MSHSATINALAWIITISGALAFVSSAAAAVYMLIVPEARVLSSGTSLHDSYYVVVQARTVLLPLLLCMALSAAVTIIGYGSTQSFLRGTVPAQTEVSDNA